MVSGTISSGVRNHFIRNHFIIEGKAVVFGYGQSEAG
jgi:hypothetical protein